MPAIVWVADSITVLAGVGQVQLGAAAPAAPVAPPPVPPRPAAPPAANGGAGAARAGTPAEVIAGRGSAGTPAAVGMGGAGAAAGSGMTGAGGMPAGGAGSSGSPAAGSGGMLAGDSGGAGGAAAGSGGSSTPGGCATWPTATGTQMVAQTIAVSGTFDGMLKRYSGTGVLGGAGQDEDQGPLFDLANGATLKNVILGAPAADGVHCNGSCTLENVWWEDVGEDAATLQGSTASQVMTIDGGGARAASDKVFQHNGPGTMIIRNFCAQDFGKLYRSCGNCEEQYARNVQVQNVIIVPGSGTSSLVGVNANYNDTATLSAITIRARANSVTICTRYNGNNTGAEPTSAGSGADGTVCKYAASDITWMP